MGIGLPSPFLSWGCVCPVPLGLRLLSPLWLRLPCPLGVAFVAARLRRFPSLPLAFPRFSSFPSLSPLFPLALHFPSSLPYGSPRCSTMALTCRGVKVLFDVWYPMLCSSPMSGVQRFIHPMRCFTAVFGMLSGKYISDSSFLVYERIENVIIM